MPENLVFCLITLAVSLLIRFGYEFPPSGLIEMNKNPDFLNAEYDFIIVGGGSAGSVVASRLSEVSDWNVLLLEAGGDEPLLAQVPSVAPLLQDTRFNWNYSGQPQSDACLGLREGRCFYPRGKVIGGSSVLNYMLYVRGNQEDYDAWATLGNRGWAYRDVLPYFKKSEDNRDPRLAKSPYHSTGGYLTVQESPWSSWLRTPFIKAAKEMGIDIQDINGEKQIGFMIPQGTIRNGSRCSNAKAFLNPVKNRRNLHISMNSHVTRILIHRQNKTAYGVEFMNNGRLYKVYSRKEVILSAGSIGSPQLLMLSGVGPKNHLEEMDIQTVVDSPGVGQNLQDHVTVSRILFLTNQSGDSGNSLFDEKNVLEFAQAGKGPLTTFAFTEGIIFTKSNYSNSYNDFPDIQIHILSRSINKEDREIYTTIYRHTDEFYDEVYLPVEGKPGWAFYPILLHPRSKGFIKLKTNNPFEKPLIYPNYLQHPADVKTIVEGIKFMMRLSKTNALQKVGSKLYEKPLPGCTDLEFNSEEYWTCIAHYYSQSIFHLTGTCKMGPKKDKASVVNPHLLVHNVNRLRVIDASIMPNVVSGNTNAAVTMIGEKGSDLIKNSWR